MLSAVFASGNKNIAQLKCGKVIFEKNRLDASISISLG